MYFNVLIPIICEYYSIWQKMWLNKDLERRSLSWIIHLGPKCSHRCPYKRKAEGGLDRREVEAMWPQRQRLERCSHKPRNAWSHQKLEEVSNGFFPRAFGESTTLPSLPCQDKTSVVVSHPVLVICYGSHRKLIRCPIPGVVVIDSQMGTWPS